MKSIRLGLFYLLLVVFSFSTFALQAKETKFEFYYQSIEKVVQINDPEPEGWWNKAKAFVKKGTNFVKKTWESNITRNVNLGEGTKLWYSEGDPNIAYQVQRVKVTSEEQLLELMGAESADELTDGQKALLAIYQHSKSQNVKDRMDISYRSGVNVILSDTTGFDNPSEYKHVENDFWPYSSGSTIQMSSGRYNWPGSEESAQSTFVHEFCHSVDRTIKEFINPYGKDGSHFVNELSKPRSAFVEGWAEFNQMLDSEEKAESIKNNISVIRIEDKKEAGSYTNVEPETLSGEELMCVEGVNATIMYRIATEVTDGKSKVYKAFTDSRWKLFRSLKSITLQLAKNNPDDIAAIAGIIDEQTFGKLSDAEMMKYIGKSAAAKEYLKNRAEAKIVKNEEKAVEASDKGKLLDINLESDGSNPFSVR